MNQLSLDNLQTAVHTALKSWGKNEIVPPDSLSQLLLIQNQLNKTNQIAFALRHAFDQLLLDSIALLAEQDEVGAKVLNGRFIDGHITRDVANRLHASPDQINRWQRSAIEQLTQLLWQQEQNLRQARQETLEANLPPASYDKLFGFDTARQQLTELLLSPDSPWLLGIIGIGGIGKTSLADWVVRGLLPTFTYSQIAWVRVDNQPLSGQMLPVEQAFAFAMRNLAAQLWSNGGSDPLPQQMRRLRQVCQAQPHLIVVDNLETESHLSYFSEQLAPLTNPSRFLFTSRVRSTGTTAVYSHTLHEFPFADADALVRHQAQAMGLQELVEAETAVIQSIYNVSGGNPLAIKLVVSFADALPLPQILTDLEQSYLGPIEELYRHIYWQAWRTLSTEAQALLQAMPLVATSGAQPAQMQAISGLEDDAFWTAVHELTSRSLLEIQGSLQSRRYSIHRLTESFLHTEIIHWKR